MSKLVIGCGYLGLRLANLWRQNGHQVYVTTRRGLRDSPLRAAGLLPLQLDVTAPPLPDLPPVETAAVAIGYDRSSGQSIGEVYVDGLARLLEILPDSVRKLIYVSSTGVHGQADGSWVDEQSACHPIREGGRACRDAELLLAEHRLASRRIVFRLAGIYGPGRIPLARRLRNDEPLPVAADGYLNLIHVEDAARVLAAADARTTPPDLFLVSDGHPVIRREYYQFLAQLLGTPPPRFQAPPGNSAAADRARGDKRIANQKMLRELEVDLRYPSYREGLPAIVRDEGPEP
jgi:nucleoside-diphosphate-sugar epimerase